MWASSPCSGFGCRVRVCVNGATGCVRGNARGGACGGKVPPRWCWPQPEQSFRSSAVHFSAAWLWPSGSALRRCARRHRLRGGIGRRHRLGACGNTVAGRRNGRPGDHAGGRDGLRSRCALKLRCSNMRVPEYLLFGPVVRWKKLAVIVLLAAGCDGDTGRYSTIIDEANISSYPGSSFANVESLRAVSFARLQGLSAKEAIAVLRKDGFSCKAQICKNVRTVSTSNFEILYGWNPMGETIFGPRYSSTRTIKIEILRAVSAPSDLRVAYEVSHG